MHPVIQLIGCKDDSEALVVTLEVQHAGRKK